MDGAGGRCLMRTLCCGGCEQLLAGFLAKCGVTAACSLGWQKLKEKLEQ